ncbi:hypothetical protein GE21DRAFT_2972 [Neurospora crassa]|uniref:ER-bound oxygenase mpaB/mpaB'/Rubber oxygenase catalytic domain-containing protein n=1 Tax=Neurospora crassa (strain ATCC 24698 / 74-OR23-1A / CBS 708.71 / DSM 1257 / FGSC 987) TaxID=367110 RepID=Q1K8H8_NEUCR|nr:hypothetical protein NCU05384 [Neurospora crassa OR74A]EAA33961.2 hypothetical protein NCU05384 [Neurospora crassa OR74A]KHE85323.1 hypothetical protein GE21DRAFT_2972 [Neurospora crassa]|eukprot:XP_963197.2 hypothetical protein NCU05384 [Neurospora crassa OR74A]
MNTTTPSPPDSLMSAIMPSLPLPTSLVWSWTTILTVLTPSYLLLIRYLRFQRLHSYRTRFPHYFSPDGSPTNLDKMTLQDAHRIHMDLSQREFPYLYRRSLFFALFKTYSIPSISSLLLATGQLSATKSASKRATDTEVLIGEIIINPPWEKRGLEALARMNWLHGRWQKAGRIKNGDMLYTLSMFALEPARWIGRWEWRKVSVVERCALGVVWREVGELMGIGMEDLDRFGRRKKKEGEEGEEGESGLEWMEKMKRWSDWYEDTEVRYTESNEKVAKHTVDLLLLSQPSFLRGVGKGFIGVLMGKKLREAMNFPEPPQWQEKTLTWILLFRRWLLLHLSPPRPEWMVLHKIDKDVDPATGKYHYNVYELDPWYVKPTFWKRWGPSALLSRLAGAPVPGDGDSRFQPEGYHIHEVGPEKLRGQGKEEIEEMVKDLERRRLEVLAKGGCIGGTGGGRCPMGLA